MSSTAHILKINRNALAPTGDLLSLAEQYAQWALVKEMKGPRAASAYLPFVLMRDCAQLGIEPLAGKPLVLFNHALRHIDAKHGLSIAELSRLTEGIVDNLLAYQDPIKESHYIFVLQRQDELGNRYIAAMAVDVSHNGIELNSLTSVHEKAELARHIQLAMDREREVYVSERTGAWLRSSKEWELGDEAERSLTKALKERLSELYVSKYPEKAALEGFVPEGVPTFTYKGQTFAPWRQFSKETYGEDPYSQQMPGMSWCEELDEKMGGFSYDEFYESARSVGAGKYDLYLALDLDTENGLVCPGPHLYNWTGTVGGFEACHLKERPTHGKRASRHR